uniref:Uncharacterized protein n=1 Tax=Arundo donax TaxID=35708 RepID=A0A0A9HAN5_ARUDO
MQSTLAVNYRLLTHYKRNLTY